MAIDKEQLTLATMVNDMRPSQNYDTARLREYAKKICMDDPERRDLSVYNAIMQGIESYEMKRDKFLQTSEQPQKETPTEPEEKTPAEIREEKKPQIVPPPTPEPVEEEFEHKTYKFNPNTGEIMSFSSWDPDITSQEEADKRSKDSLEKAKMDKMQYEQEKMREQVPEQAEEIVQSDPAPIEGESSITEEDLEEARDRVDTIKEEIFSEPEEEEEIIEITQVDESVKTHKSNDSYIKKSLPGYIANRERFRDGENLKTVRLTVAEILNDINKTGVVEDSDINTNLGKFVKKDFVENSSTMSKMPVMASTMETYERLNISLPFLKDVKVDKDGNLQQDGTITTFVKDMFKSLFEMVVPGTDDDESTGTATSGMKMNMFAKKKFMKSGKYATDDGSSLMSNTMGMSPVLNPPYQFNENDDVPSDVYFPEYGRLFNTHIVSNYPTVIFEVGRVDYNQGFIKSLADAYTDPNQKETTKMIEIIRKSEDTGTGTNILLAPIAELIKFGSKVIAAPVTGLTAAKDTVAGALRWATGLNKAAVFVNQTDLFNKYCDNMMLTIATNMGLIGKPGGNYDSKKYKSLDDPQSMAKQQQSPSKEDIYPNAAATKGAGNEDKSKAYYDAVVSGKPLDGKTFKAEDYDDYYGDLQFLRMAYIQPLTDIMGGSNIYPYVTHRDVVVNESYSNSTKENPIAEALNAKFGAADQTKADLTGGKGTDFATQLIKGDKGKVLAEVGDYFKKNISSSASGSVVISGDGRITLPALWENSSMDRSIDLEFEFYSPYGHELAIFESCIVPMIPLLNMTLPRQISDRAFMNPFYVRVFSKGLFQIPMGMVTSLTIDRNTSESNTMTDALISKSYKVSMSLTDLNPTIMTGISSGIFAFLSMNNDNYTNMLNTMSGLSFFNTRNIGSRIQRFLAQVKHKYKFITSIMSPNYDRNNPLLWFRDFPVVKNVFQIASDLGLSGNTKYY